MDDRHPWEQLPGESGPAYRAFLVYRDLGPERTVTLCARKLSEATAPGGAEKGRNRGGKGAESGETKRKPEASGRIRKWAKDNRWAERAAAHDHFVAKAKAKGEAKAIESYAAKRQREALEAENVALALANQLKLQAFQILQSKLYTTTDTVREESPDGKTIIIHRTIEPAGFRIRDAAVMAKAARELEDTVFKFSRREQEQTVATQADAGPRAVTATVQSEAGNRVEAHRSSMRVKMLTLPSTPPGKPDGPVEGPEP